MPTTSQPAASCSLLRIRCGRVWCIRFNPVTQPRPPPSSTPQQNTPHHNQPTNQSTNQPTRWLNLACDAIRMHGHDNFVIITDHFSRTFQPYLSLSPPPHTHQRRVTCSTKRSGADLRLQFDGMPDSRHQDLRDHRQQDRVAGRDDGGTATSTLFWTISREAISSTPPHTHRVCGWQACSSGLHGSSGADLMLDDWCLQSDVVLDSRDEGAPRAVVRPAH